MKSFLFFPPIAFLIILFVSWLVSRIFSRLAFRTKKQTEGSRQPYACGEKNFDYTAQPDYTNFFPFAFFFTLAHVATLIMTTVPVKTLDTFTMVIIYIIGAALGLYIIFRR
jgi:NADH-quinone oxidoreductase subunit A